GICAACINSLIAANIENKLLLAAELVVRLSQLKILDSTSEKINDLERLGFEALGKLSLCRYLVQYAIVVFCPGFREHGADANVWNIHLAHLLAEPCQLCPVFARNYEPNPDKRLLKSCSEPDILYYFRPLL